MRILLSGGGTAGPVTPLLAVVQSLKAIHPDTEFLWIGTYRGPEHKLVPRYNIRLISIFSGKLRRYFAWQNFIDPLFIVFGFFQSVYIVKRFNPDVVVSAGGFVSVPVALAAWLFRKKIIIHQLDVKKGLANTVMAPLAHHITVSFAESRQDFSQKKVTHIGTPIREEIVQGDRDRGIHAFNLDPSLPTLLVLGGGTGSLQLNKIMSASLPELLLHVQVLHITGVGKKVSTIGLKEKAARYHQFEFVTEEMPNIYAAADVVVSRAGMGTLTELALLGKPTIAIPIPHSQQVANAQYFFEKKAIIVFDQTQLSAQTFTSELLELINDQDSQRYLHKHFCATAQQGAAERLATIVWNAATAHQMRDSNRNQE